MKGKYKTSFDEIIFRNRWRMPRYSRPANFVLIGISKDWFSPNSFTWKFSLCGLDVCFWFKRDFIKLTY